VVTLAIAASTAHVIEPLASAYSAAHELTIVCNAGASSTLARQIEEGAPAEIFISANVKWMDYLDERSLIQAASRHDLLANRLAVVVPADAAASVLAPLTSLLSSDFQWLALGDPDHVPAGLYAKEALAAMGLWETVHERILPARDVRAALLLVERGEAELGIVYATDAASSGRVAVAGLLPEQMHQPIRYPAALTVSASPEAEAFLAWLTNPACREAFASAGFDWRGEP
jgi:molybdate transport system substrate-binding protein